MCCPKFLHTHKSCKHNSKHASRSRTDFHAIHNNNVVRALARIALVTLGIAGHCARTCSVHVTWGVGLNLRSLFPRPISLVWRISAIAVFWLALSDIKHKL